MAAICTPTTSVRGRGSILHRYVRQETQQIQTIYGEQHTNRADIHEFIAEPAAGWEFLRFEVKYSYDRFWNVGLPTEWHETKYGAEDYANNTVRTLDFSNTSTVAPSMHRIWEYYYTDERWYYKYLSYNITAVFRRLGLTHLLLNSSTVESPAKLVYDPTTHLLVADY